MTDTTRPPFKSLTPVAILTHAISVAMREAELDGLLTKETVFRISERADKLVAALFDGKVVELAKNGTATIRDALPEEEIEMSAEEFPHHAKAKTILDI